MLIGVLVSFVMAALVLLGCMVPWLLARRARSCTVLAVLGGLLGFVVLPAVMMAVLLALKGD